MLTLSDKHTVQSCYPIINLRHPFTEPVVVIVPLSFRTYADKTDLESAVGDTW